MWRFSCADKLTNHNKTGLTANMRQFGFDIRKSQHWLCCIVVIMVILLPNSRSDAHLRTSKRPATGSSSHSYKSSKYTIEDLINRKFSYKVSNDIDMDPCKASTYLTQFCKKKSVWIFNEAFNFGCLVVFFVPLTFSLPNHEPQPKAVSIEMCV